jgi:tRNA G10  N-methylase Trm11
VAMVEMVKSDDEEEMKRQIINEPSVGCGSILLAASNYFLRGYGQDISRIAIKLCKIQMYWYAPWFAYHPDTIKGFDLDDYITIASDKKAMEGQLVFAL